MQNFRLDQLMQRTLLGESDDASNHRHRSEHVEAAGRHRGRMASDVRCMCKKSGCRTVTGLMQAGSTDIRVKEMKICESQE